MDGVLGGDARDLLRALDAESIQCCVTSPPYYGLRDYGVGAEQLGWEPSPAVYVQRLVEIFREVKRVLRKDGTLWLNLGDSYAAKQLLGIPWQVAFALQADGWYLRQDIIWHKVNPLPESVRDRCTKAHEYIFLLSKERTYYYDAAALSEPAVYPGDDRGSRPDARRGTECNAMSGVTGTMRNKRSVWSIVTQPYHGAHFAAFPEELPRLCILAGSREGDVVLDPFAGSGTTLYVAKKLGRRWVGAEINPEYRDMALARLASIPESLFKL